MSNINNMETQANIKKVEEFAKYLKNNFNYHRKQFKNSENISDIEISVAFLRDYAEVSEKLMKVINEYCEKTGFEF